MLSQKDIVKILKELKSEFQKDGFIIEGFFGSYARKEEKENSDIDILYSLKSSFYNKYSGFIGFKKLDEIKIEISKRLNKKVDLAPKNNLSKTAKKYILKDLKYV